MNSKNILIYLVMVAVGALVFFLASQLVRPYQFRGSVIDPPLTAQDFVLTAGDGQEYQLSQKNGKVVVLFFGFTNCPDVCPTTLAEYRQVRMLLGDKADRVDFLFITVDPQRDTPEKMLAYVSAFDPAITGLTGTMDELLPVWGAYGVARREYPVDSALGYLLEHSARTYAIDKAGNLRVTYMFGTDPADLAQDIAYLLGEE